MSSAIDQGLQSIANDISHGFESLLAQLDAQKKTEGNLRQQLAKAVQRVSSPSTILVPASHDVTIFSSRTEQQNAVIDDPF